MVKEIIKKIHGMSIEEVEKEKNMIREKCLAITDKIHKTNDKKEIDELYKKLDELNDLFELYCFIPNSRMIGENENITLWKEYYDEVDPLSGGYIIRDKKDMRNIGSVSFSPKLTDTYFGSIGCTVYSKFNGHGYAFQALCILSNYLRANGVDRITMNALVDNIPSLKTIEKFRNYLGGGDCKIDKNVVFNSFDLSLLDQKSL